MKLEKVILKINKLLAIEKKRYYKKGLANISVSLILLFGMIWLALNYGKKIWPNDVKNKQLFVLIGSLICYYAILTICFIFYHSGYAWTIKFFHQHAIKIMPLQTESSNQTSKHKQIIKILIIHQFLLFPISLYLLFNNKISVSQREFPSLPTCFQQIQIMHFTQDLVGFLGHKMSHSLSFFSKTHKIHHDFNKTQWWVSEYFHPLEPACACYIMALGIHFCTGCSVHCIVIFFWICWKTIINIQNHAGYQFQWSPTRVLPFIADPSYHLYHHDHYMENYAATCYVWDVLNDTNTKYISKFLTA